MAQSARTSEELQSRRNQIRVVVSPTTDSDRPHSSDFRSGNHAIAISSTKVPSGRRTRFLSAAFFGESQAAIQTDRDSVRSSQRAASGPPNPRHPASTLLQCPGYFTIYFFRIFNAAFLIFMSGSSRRRSTSALTDSRTLAPPSSASRFSANSRIRPSLSLRHFR